MNRRRKAFEHRGVEIEIENLCSGEWQATFDVGEESRTIVRKRMGVAIESAKRMIDLDLDYYERSYHRSVPQDQTRVVEIDCDYENRIVHVAIKRNRGSYVTSRYQLKEGSPSAIRLGKLLAENDEYRVDRIGVLAYEIPKEAK
jgi:hypothetical protein